MPTLIEVKHPLVQHKLSIMRDKSTSCHVFRQLLKEISQLLAYEVTSDLALTVKEIETPLVRMQAPTLSTDGVVLISILRAGNGLLDGIMEVSLTSYRAAPSRVLWSVLLCQVMSLTRRSWFEKPPLEGSTS